MSYELHPDVKAALDKVEAAARRLDEVGKAQGELIVELTKHADALRETVLALVDQQAMPDDFWRPAVDAYDNFIKEC
jgi:hypothetical protein